MEESLELSSPMMILGWANANDGEAVYIEVLTKEGEAHVQVYGVEVPNDEPSIACSCWGLKQDEIRLAHEFGWRSKASTGMVGEIRPSKGT